MVCSVGWKVTGISKFFYLSITVSKEQLKTGVVAFCSSNGPRLRILCQNTVWLGCQHTLYNYHISSYSLPHLKVQALEGVFWLFSVLC